MQKNTIGLHHQTLSLEWGLTTTQSSVQGDMTASIQKKKNPTDVDTLSGISTIEKKKLLRTATLPSGEAIDAKNTVGGMIIPPTVVQRSDDDDRNGNYNRVVDRLLHSSTDEATARVGRRGGETTSSPALTTINHTTTNDTSPPSIHDSTLTTPIIIVVNDTTTHRDVPYDPLLVIAEARYVRDGSTTEPSPARPTPENTISNDGTNSNHPTLRWILCIFAIVLIAAVAGVVGFLVCGGDGCAASKESIPSLDSSRPIIARIVTAIPTSIPRMTTTTTPTVSREHADQVIRYINNITLSGIIFVGLNTTSSGTIMDEASEQALRWIIYEDPMHLLPDTPSRQFQLVQRYALRTVIGQQSFPNNWNESTWALSECDWYGINCTSLWLGNETGEQRVVTSIDFIGIIVNGILPADIGLLSSVLYVDISLSSLQGTIPESIGNWKSITHMDLQGNQLTGSLPSSIGNWHNVTSLYLHKNELTGSLPSSFGNWHSISHLNFGYNSVAGSFPNSTGNWRNLESLSMMHNSLTGSIPSSIGNWKAATYIDFTFNSLTGTLPSSIGNWQLIQYVDFSYNQLRGTFPSTIGKGWKRVTDVNFRSNTFTGVVPTDWCQLTTLKLLWADCDTEVSCKCCTACT